MDELDDIEAPLPPAAVAPWKGKEALLSDSDSESDDGGLDAFDANPPKAASPFSDDESEDSESDSESEDDDDDFQATADDVAAWTSGLSPPPRPRRDRSLSYEDGSRYRGDTLGGLRHGAGVLECPNGDRYEGGWRLGLRHGRGKASFPSRSREGDVGYEGDWRDDKADGQGRATYENGGFYEGAFSKGVRCGWGRHVFPPPTAAADVAVENGKTPSPTPSSYYEGEWLDDAPHGNGVHSCPVGGTFVGTWSRGSRSRGCWTSADGREEYEGEWRVVDSAENESEERRSAPSVDPLVAAVRHGKGTLVVLGVSKYVGEWEEDLPSGEGELRHADGSVYRGGFRRGERHGFGALERGDGSFYRGEWRDGREHGRGAALLPCGDEYEGEWLEGRRHGSGRGTCGPRSDDSYDGDWSEGRRHGRGRCSFGESGDTYDGEWREGERHGHGACVFGEDGARFEGEWRRGRWVQGPADASLSEPVALSEGDGRGDGDGDGEGRKRPGLLPLLSAVAGRRSSFAIRARDSRGQPRLSGGDSFVAWVECGVDSRRDGAGGGRGGDVDVGDERALVDPTAAESARFLERVDADVVDRGDGTYLVSYVPRVAGEARLHVSLLSSSSGPGPTTTEAPPPTSSFVPVADSPYTLRVEPGPPAKRQEIVSGLPREISRGKEREAVVFWIQPRDDSGNACGPLDPAVFSASEVVARVGASYEARAETRQLPDGRIECSFSGFGDGCPVGLGTVEVFLSSPSSSSSSPSARHARGSPFSISVVDGANSKAETKTTTEPVQDEAAAWERAAREAFVAVDGDGEGWDDDGGEKRPGERDDGGDSAESLSELHPGVPIVERLEDIWQVAKLHRERKEREELEKRGDATEGGGDESDDDALGAAEVAAKAAEDASRAAVAAAAAKRDAAASKTD